MPKTTRLAGAPLLALLLVTAACSGDAGNDTTTAIDSATITTTTPASDSAAAAASATPTTAPGDLAAPEAPAAPAAEPLAVELSVTSPELDLDEVLAGAVSADADPFGDFATCAAYRDVIGIYSVGIGSVAGDVRWISVVSGARPAGPGIVDADVRLELADGAAVEATGTMTLDDGLASGSYVAFDTSGRRVEGDFDCSGGTGSATASGDEGGVIEVVALLDRAGMERLVSLSVADTNVWARCEESDDGSVLVRVDGDEAVGSISGFDLQRVGDAPASIRMQVGATVVESSGVDVAVPDGEGDAGTFVATADDGTDVNGAFGCA